MEDSGGTGRATYSDFATDGMIGQVNNCFKKMHLRFCLSTLLCLGAISFVGSVSPLTLEAHEKPFLRELRREKLSKFILAFDVANGSDLAAAALSDLHVRIWKLDSGEIVHEFSFPEPATDHRLKLDLDVEPISLHFSADGKTLAVGFLSRIYLYDVATWQERMTLGVAGEDDHRSDLEVSPAVPQLQRRSAEQAQIDKEKPVPDLNQTMREWAAQRALGDGRTRITDFAFSADGSFLLVAYCRGGFYASPGHRWEIFPIGKDPLRLWDIRTGEILWEKAYDPEAVINRIALSPDGKRFAAVSAPLGHCEVGLYDLGDGHHVFSLAPVGACPPSLNFRRDGGSFITARTPQRLQKNRKDRPWERLATYETDTGKMIADFSGGDTVREANLSSDGRWLLSTSWWGLRFQIWDAQSGKPIISETPNRWKSRRAPLDRVCISPDGRWLVVGSDEIGELIVYQFGPGWSQGNATD